MLDTMDSTLGTLVSQVEDVSPWLIVVISMPSIVLEAPIKMYGWIDDHMDALFKYCPIVPLAG